MKHYIKFIWLLTLFLAGCGFHLRGTIDIPKWLSNVAVIVEKGDRNLAPLLKEQLQAYDIDVSNDPALAKYWLIIENDATQKQIMSVSSTTTPRQYQLIYTVRFSLQNRQGKVLMPSNKISVTRQWTANNDRILGSNQEEELLKAEMKKDAAVRILNRLSHVPAA